MAKADSADHKIFETLKFLGQVKSKRVEKCKIERKDTNKIDVHDF